MKIVSKMRQWIVAVIAVITFCGMASAQTPGVKSLEIVRIADTDYYLHAVVQGETVYSLMKLYGIDEARFYEDNPAIKQTGLKAGDKVRIVCVNVPERDIPKRKLQKTFYTHKVEPGETTFGIAKKYSMSIATLIQDNPGLDPSHLATGQQLLIRKSETDKTSPQTITQQMGDMANTLTSVSDEYKYHLVEMGETLYAISKKYDVEIEKIEANNNISGGLKAGVLLRIPVKPAIVVTEPVKTVNENVTDKGLPVKRPYYGALDIAMLLPLSENGVMKSTIMELYQGALIAVDELRREGHNINVNLFNTERSQEVIQSIIPNPSFRDADLIIGPVYEDGLQCVAEYSAQNGIPLVSPLANVTGNYGNTVFQMSPDPSMKYIKVKELIAGGDKNVIFITADVTDQEFDREMTKVFGNNHYSRITYRKGSSSGMIDNLLSNDKENVFVVLAGNETGVDYILASLSSVQNSRVSRSRSTGAIKVIGNSKWTRYNNLDRNLLFKLNVSYITSYHADRGNANVLNFDNRYIETFGRIPTLYSYRGYDAVKMFGTATASGKRDYIEALGAVSVPLQTPYRFDPDINGNVSNDAWVLVTYGNNYTINVK